MSSKLPWVHPIPVKPVTQSQIYFPNTTTSSRPVMVKQRKVPSVRHKDRSKVKENIAEKNKNEEFTGDNLNVNTSSNATVLDEGEIGPLHQLSLSALELLSASRKQRQPGASMEESNLSATGVSEQQVSFAPSKMSNNNTEYTEQPLASLDDSDTNTVPKKTGSASGGGSNKESSSVLLSKEKPLCPPVPPNLGKYLPESL